MWQVHNTWVTKSEMLVAVHPVPWTVMGVGEGRPGPCSKVTNHSWVLGAYEEVVNATQTRRWSVASPRPHSS